MSRDEISTNQNCNCLRRRATERRKVYSSGPWGLRGSIFQYVMIHVKAVLLYSRSSSTSKRKPPTTTVAATKIYGHAAFSSSHSVEALPLCCHKKMRSGDPTWAIWALKNPHISAVLDSKLGLQEKKNAAAKANIASGLCKSLYQPSLSWSTMACFRS